MSEKKSRPTGVTVMGVLQILGGLGSLGLGFFLAATYAFLGSLMASGSEGVAFSAGFGGFLVVAGVIIGGILMLIGIANLVIAYGLFKGKGWAWMLCLIFAVISAVFGILMFPVGIVTILFNALIIYYLTRRNVKEYFGRAA
jgi:hypothetical protein